MDFKDTVDFVGKAIDAAGVGVMIAGIVLATALAVPRVMRKEPGRDVYRDYRQSLGRAILLSLELLVAADIIRTVAVSPTLRSVLVLAIIVAVRTFLSMALEVELEGRWPWQQRAPERGDAAGT